jgi:dTDP-4-dehydrorhamnose reductase
MRLIILGSTGMLGQAVARQALSAGLETVEVSRSGKVRWDYFRESFASLASRLDISEHDVLVNCIGWIPQKSSGDAGVDEQRSKALNVDLISEIQSHQDEVGFKWIQIATDCVFSGETGGYTENSRFDPIDLYGRTKVAGELLMPGAMKVRSSIIGMDSINKSGLYEWFKGRPIGARLQGYQDHQWNGVSTIAFARLSIGLALQGLVVPSHQHWIPADSLSKYDLIQLFKEHIPRPDIDVVPVAHSRGVNRTVQTLSPERNLELWAVAGYLNVPSIEELVVELVSSDLEDEG